MAKLDHSKVEINVAFSQNVYFYHLSEEFQLNFRTKKN